MLNFIHNKQQGNARRFNLFTIEYLRLTIKLSVLKKSTRNDIPKKPLKF